MNPTQPQSTKFDSQNTTCFFDKFHYCMHQYRFLTLLLILAAIGLSWFAVHRQQVHRQRKIVKAIEDNGGYIRYSYQVNENNQSIRGAKPPGPTWLRKRLGNDFFTHPTMVFWVGSQLPSDDDFRKIANLARIESIGVVCAHPTGGEDLLRGTIPITDAGLAHIKKLARLRSLGLNYSQITDAGLEYLKGLSHLKSLNLSCTSITDKGLEHLKGMTQLNHLDLHGTRITDEGLKHLTQMRCLSELSLARTQVTDVGLKNIDRLSNIEILDLSNTEVTDAGLKYLGKMQQLRDLNLRHTQITDAGLQMLESLPCLRTLTLDSPRLTGTAIDEYIAGNPDAESFLKKFGTLVTDKGVKKLQKALPNLTVKREK